MISVVLPCYKDACHLRQNVRKIAQILELLGREFEIILVNDASPDETGAGR
jgi:glycosyltransferase involved in cell wall biosynthesis